MKWFRDIGPGALIAAAFIGPGTVTLCTIAGASFGYSLIWAILLSTFSTIVLQEMSLRIGLITKMNLAEVISCLLYTSPSPRDMTGSRMPSSA